MLVSVGVPVVLELDDGELPSDLYWVEGEDLRPILRRVLNVDLNRRRRPIEVELNRKVNIVFVAEDEKGKRKEKKGKEGRRSYTFRMYKVLAQMFGQL